MIQRVLEFREWFQGLSEPTQVFASFVFVGLALGFSILLYFITTTWSGND